MENFNELLEQLKQKKLAEGIPEVLLQDCTFLFLDISSSCTGFAIAKINFMTKTAELTKAGAIWLDSDWEHGKKYDYMYDVVQNFFYIVESADYLVVEQYSINTKKLMGVSVVSEMQGAIKAAAYSNGLKVESILPQQWRSILKIKADVKNGKRDYKTPTKVKINSLVKVPDEITSNLTGKKRQTPSDVYDAMAIALAWLSRNGIKVKVDNCDFTNYVNYSKD